MELFLYRYKGTFQYIWAHYIDGLVQDCSNSRVLEME